MITISGVNPNMIANNIEPLYPTHPGEVLKDEIEYRKLSQKKLASDMGVSYTSFNEVLNAKRPLNTELALLIEAALGLDAIPLLQMQARYNILVAKRNNIFIEKLKKVTKIAVVY